MPTQVQNDVYARIKQAVVSTITYWAANPFPLNAGQFYQRLQGCGGVYSQPDYDTDSTNVDYPCVMCCYSGLTPQFLGGDSVSRAFNWPVMVLILDNPGKGVIENEPVYTGWIKDIFDLFHQEKLFDYDQTTGFPNLVREVCGGMVEGNVIFDLKNPKFLNVNMGLLLKFEAWETR